MRSTYFAIDPAFRFMAHQFLELSFNSNKLSRWSLVNLMLLAKVMIITLALLVQLNLLDTGRKLNVHKTFTNCSNIYYLMIHTICVSAIKKCWTSSDCLMHFQFTSYVQRDAFVLRVGVLVMNAIIESASSKVIKSSGIFPSFYIIVKALKALKMILQIDKSFLSQ